MATRGRGRARSRESRNEQSADSHAEFMAAMANLANTMEANAATTLQVVQRLAQPAGSRNENGEGAEDSLRGVPRTLAAFWKAGPPVFNGSTNHNEADNWFQALERALLPQHVPYDQFVEHATYQLVGEAQQWWQEERRLLHQQNVKITWALFEEAFYKKYFLESLREARELELLQLKQGSTTIAEYNSKFEELCRFSRISQGTSGSYEGWKCVKYEVGLREDIRRVMAPLEIRRFFELVDKVRVVEEHPKTIASSKDTLGGNTSRERNDYLGPRGRNFKRYDEGKQSRAYSPTIKCQECGNYHPNKPCQLGKKLYYKCG
ncbi:uncharacterized protein LOC107607479 [Arachis ipaensis]|uniref:uncharacterized protein LOC107607479 n=1 Tax=Arachis ipaensis TaxID=130454 RepID=UPI0007AEF25A|nr:uncharacterized protein LOC107607479 [Arachis ipaensis]